MKDLCPYCRQRTVVKVLQKNVESLSSVQCEGCKRTYELSLDEETTMHKSIERLEQESAVMHAELAKATEANVEFVYKIAAKLAESTPAEIAKWDPGVRAQVREEVSAAVARVRVVSGDGGSDAISKFFISAQGLLEKLGATGSTKALDAADFEKMSPTDQIKHLQAAGGQLMHKRGPLPDGAQIRDPRDLICYR